MTLENWIIQALIYFPSSIIVGVMALMGIRWTLSHEAGMQREEFEERETARRNDFQAREKTQHETEERKLTAAARAVAVEAMNNAVALLTFGQLVKRNPFARFSVALAREQFDSQLPLIAERLSPAHLQLVARVYLEAFRYKDLVDDKVQKFEQLSEKQVKDGSDVSFGFSVAFRTIAPPVFNQNRCV